MEQMKKSKNTPKAYLQSYRWAMMRRDALREEIAREYESVTRLTSRMDSVHPGGNGPGDSIASTVCRVVDARTQLDEAQRQIDASLARVLAAIEAPPDERQKALLTLRYINGLSWEEIQERIGYERTQTLTLHSRALAAVELWLAEKEKVNRPIAARS